MYGVVEIKISQSISCISVNPLTIFEYVSISSIPGDQLTLKQVKLTGKIKQPEITKFFMNHNNKNTIIIRFSFSLNKFIKFFL